MFFADIGKNKITLASKDQLSQALLLQASLKTAETDWPLRIERSLSETSQLTMPELISQVSPVRESVEPDQPKGSDRSVEDKRLRLGK